MYTYVSVYKKRSQTRKENQITYPAHVYVFRCFALVESTGLEQVASLDRMVSSVSSGNHESVMGMGTAGALHSILVQCSPSIFQVNLSYSVYTCIYIDIYDVHK